jgi:hypothetical protein
MIEKTTSLPPRPRGGPGVLGPWVPQVSRNRASFATRIAAAMFVRRFGKSA